MKCEVEGCGAEREPGWVFCPAHRASHVGPVSSEASPPNECRFKPGCFDWPECGHEIVGAPRSGEARPRTWSERIRTVIWAWEKHPEVAGVVADLQLVLEQAPCSEAAQPLAEERERCARWCEVFASMLEDGAGDPPPGARLRQAAENIRSGKPCTLWDGLDAGRLRTAEARPGR